MAKLKKAVKAIGIIANPKAAVADAVIKNVMGPKGKARRAKRRAKRAARKASAMGGQQRKLYVHGGEVMPTAKPN